LIEFFLGVKNMSNVDQIIQEVIKVEGGYVDDPDDKGSVTNLGITIATLSEFLGRDATKDEVKELDVETATQIYKQNFWDRYKADQLPEHLQHAYFDLLVNSGPRNAGRILQKACVNRGTLEIGEVDGIVGPGTLAACENLTLDDLLVERAVFYANLVFDGSRYLERTNQDKFIRGWMKHRVFEFIRQDARRQS
tara:strand:- start:1002 stop:1583 length:582 start_codon:yes stop_codon:yes gene_type:complete